MELAAKNWYAIYTRARWEKKVARQLSQKGIEHYCPLVKVQRQWSDRKKIIFEPLFNSYVFVRIDEREHTQITNVEGYINLVYWLKKPAVIRAEEIDAIRKFLDDHDQVHLERVNVNLDDHVRIVGGPFMELEGKVVEIKSRTVKVMLPSLGFALVAELDKVNVQLITSRSNANSGAYFASGR